MSEVTVKALRTFDWKGELKTKRSPEFDVSRSELADLKANGLAEEIGGSKKAPEPENKMAEEPANKAEPVGDAEQKRRGRPPKAED